MTELKEEFIHIQTTRFLVEPGEDEEIFNEGTYGAALSTYLEIELNKRGYTGGAICEDWGYWLGVSHPENPNTVLQAGVYCPNGENENPMEYVVLVMTHKTKKWVWSKFKFVSFAPKIVKLQADIRDILNNAPETKVLSVSDDMPD
jgi:hypothetical protein